MIPNEPQTEQASETANGENKANPVLPPLKSEADTTAPPPSKEGLSPALKRGIILFTAFTVLAFAAFTMLLVKKFVSPGTVANEWDNEILTVAEQLHQAGLDDQALEQYERFLTDKTLDRQLRGRVAYTAGSLYLDLGNCTQGLVMLFQAQAAHPEAPWKEDMTKKIDACLSKVKSPPKK